MRFIQLSLVLMFLMTIWFPGPLAAHKSQPPPESTGFNPDPEAARREVKAPIKLISPGLFHMGEIRIDKVKGRITFPARVNMDQGLLEYLLVGRAGKTHESLLITDVEPYALHLACLLLGLEGTTSPLAHQGEARTPKGDPIDLQIRPLDGAQGLMSIEQWVSNEQNKATMPETRWVFTGSFIHNGIFMAQMEKSMIAVFHDPVALIDHTSPQGQSDEIWFVNEHSVPAVGTKVEVVITNEKPLE